jgi:hypothetical protein
MRLPVALISAALGAAFFVVANLLYYQPSLINDYTLSVLLTTNHSKARAAVSRLLFNPASAQFDVLRSVETDAAKYVCGNVNAKDKAGEYAGNRAFVYTVAIDFARVDDDGRIAQKHAAFKECPESDAEKLAKQKTEISPGALSMLSNVQKIIPPADPATLPNLASRLSPPSGKSSGATTEQLLGQLASPQNSAGQQSSSTSKPNIDAESEWRSDRPPAAWPVFPADHPLTKPPMQKRTTADTMAMVKEVERRAAQFKEGNSKSRPSPDDIREALRALLAIDPKDNAYPEAWAAFVRLRKIERDFGYSVNAGR